jgi:hypothetical protein
MPARKIEPPAGYESLTDAATRRGVSVRTLTRQIEAGAAEAERIQRPQGTVLFVKIPGEAAPNAVPNPAPVGSAGNDQEQKIGGIEAAITAAVDPLERRLAFADQLIRTNGETMIRQAETIGRLTAERDAAVTRASELQTQLEALRSTPWWRRIFG